MVSLADSSEELAKVYSEMSDVQKEHGKELIEQLSLAKNMKVLDFGCGTATFLLCRLTVRGRREKWWLLIQMKLGSPLLGSIT